MAHGLQQQGALASARAAADKNAGTRHKTATQDAIKLLRTRRKARQILQIDILQHTGTIETTGKTRTIARHREAPTPSRLGWPQLDLRQRVPGPTITALALPLHVIGAAIVADKGGFLFCH